MPPLGPFVGRRRSPASYRCIYLIDQRLFTASYLAASLGPPEPLGRVVSRNAARHADPLSGHSVGISVGQRILIAQALAGCSRMPVLDEATSALDNVAQLEVTRTLERLQLTRIVVAHRLSTIEDADRVLVLRDGRLVEQGPYAQLVATGGELTALARRQLL